MCREGKYRRMTAQRTADGIAVPPTTIRRDDRVITADGVEIGRVRSVQGTDALNGRILVMGFDAQREATAVYTIPLWAPLRRDAATARLYLSAHLTFVCSRWSFASVL